MPKEKYDPPDPRRIYTIMSAEEVANGKKSHWAELEISGELAGVSIPTAGAPAHSRSGCAWWFQSEEGVPLLSSCRESAELEYVAVVADTPDCSAPQ